MFSLILLRACQTLGIFKHKRFVLEHECEKRAINKALHGAICFGFNSTSVDMN